MGDTWAGPHRSSDQAKLTPAPTRLWYNLRTWTIHGKGNVNLHLADMEQHIWWYVHVTILGPMAGTSPANCIVSFSSCWLASCMATSTTNQLGNSWWSQHNFFTTLFECIVIQLWRCRPLDRWPFTHSFTCYKSFRLALDVVVDWCGYFPGSSSSVALRVSSISSEMTVSSGRHHFGWNKSSGFQSSFSQSSRPRWFHS